MKRVLPTFLLATCLVAAQKVPVFKSDVSLVMVDADVTDGTRQLSGFQKADFRVFDNGTEQDLLYVSQGEEPLDVILLFDLSKSMMPKLQLVAASAQAALAELRQEDRVAVMVFGWNTRVVQPFTEDLALVAQAINEKVLNMYMGGTSILAAIDHGAKQFRREPRTQRRRAIVIITDNHGMVSGRESTVVRKLWEADVVLIGLQVRYPGETEKLAARRDWRDRENMTGVSEKTGGNVVGSVSGREFVELMHRLRLRYCLYYAMPQGTPGEERRIKVVLSADAQRTNPEGRVRARTGYKLPKR